MLLLPITSLFLSFIFAGGGEFAEELPAVVDITLVVCVLLVIAMGGEAGGGKVRNVTAS